MKNGQREVFQKMKVELFPLDQSLPFWVYRAQTQGVTTLRRTFQSAGYDLTPEQYAALARLSEKEGVNQSQLGERMLKDRHNMTRILSLLEKRGYVERRADQADKRMYRIFLTEAGRNIRDSVTPVVLNHLNQMYSGLTPEDFLTMRRILEHIVANLEQKET
jgi:MarR family transcriptional regulator, organic hydroperoxide resistance regulator